MKLLVDCRVPMLAPFTAKVHYWGVMKLETITGWMDSYLLVNSWGIVQGSNNDLSKKRWEIGSGDMYYGHTGVPSARVGTSLSI